MEQPQRIWGVVATFNPQKAFGFISGQDGQNYFVHRSEINSDNRNTLNEGEEVEFTALETTKGLAATNVKVL